MVTVAWVLVPTRFPESTAKPTTVKVPVVPVTRTESLNSIESGNGGLALDTESAASATCPAGAISHPTRRTPEACTAITSMGTYLPDEATAPQDGATRLTCRACTLP